MSCKCGKPGTRKVAEELPANSPYHPLTSYLCHACFCDVMGLAAETSPPHVPRFDPRGDIVFQYKKWLDNRTFTRDNPPTFDDVVEISPGLYRASDYTLWKYGPPDYPCQWYQVDPIDPLPKSP